MHHDDTPGSATASSDDALAARLRDRQRTWLVTGAAGFIGSHLAGKLLSLGQHVVGLDNFSSGTVENVAAVKVGLSAEHAARYDFIEGDIRDPAACRSACRGVDVVLHEAALGSVPRSVANPVATHDVNVTGFLHVLEAARAAGTRRVIYASSSSVYGDDARLPKVEDSLGRALSPYAATKQSDESYAAAYARCYGLEVVGLRYFNVFGPRQDPTGPYAAVIPLWFEALVNGKEVSVYGDGETSRDFCYVENVVQANLLAATTTSTEALGQAFNVGCGARTTLRELFDLIRERVARVHPAVARRELTYRDFRPGDIRHSLADVTRARALLGYEPTYGVRAGLDRAAAWYLARARAP